MTHSLVNVLVSTFLTQLQAGHHIQSLQVKDAARPPQDGLRPAAGRDGHRGRHPRLAAPDTDPGGGGEAQAQAAAGAGGKVKVAGQAPTTTKY